MLLIRKVERHVSVVLEEFGQEHPHCKRSWNQDTWWRLSTRGSHETTDVSWI